MSGLAASLEDGIRILTIKEPERRNPLDRPARFSNLSDVESWVEGGGRAIVLACEIAITAASTHLASPFGKIGMIPDIGLRVMHSARIEAGRAQPVFPNASTVEAKEGARLGFVNEPVPDRQALAKAQVMAQNLARAVAAAPRPRAPIKDCAAQAVDRALNFEGLPQPTLVFSADVMEGRRAFVDKRTCLPGRMT